MVELKACPFCGGKAFVGGYDAYSCDSSFDAIECSKCGAMSAPCGTDEELEQAKKDWNARPPKQDCADEMYEMIEKIADLIKTQPNEISLADEVCGLSYDLRDLLAKARGDG